MNTEQRQNAVFGAYDGVVSIVGFIFGLLIHHSPQSAIAIGGFGGAVSATVSMSTGVFEATDGPTLTRLNDAAIMALATVIGSSIPIWGFFVFDRTNALIAGGIGCGLAATWIGFEAQRRSWLHHGLQHSLGCHRSHPAHRQPHPCQRLGAPMSIFAILVFFAAFIVALVQTAKPWWLVPVLIAGGVALALLVTGSQVHVH